MAVSKAQQKCVNKYIGNNYDRINLTVFKGKKEVITDIAKSQDKSLNGYVKEAIKNQVKSDTGEDIEL